MKKIKQEIIRFQSPPKGLQNKLRGFYNPERQKPISNFSDPIILKKQIYINKNKGGKERIDKDLYCYLPHIKTFFFFLVGK